MRGPAGNNNWETRPSSLRAAAKQKQGEIKTMNNTPQACIIDTRRLSQSRMNESLLGLALQSGRLFDRIAVVCIGSDKITGDSYGPLTGQLLLKAGVPGAAVYGSLEKPVHALCLAETLALLDGRALVIAVDACVGEADHVGCVLMGRGPLRPGGGLGKTLPEVGDIAISGVAAPDGDAFRNLQNASLGMVYKMAEATAAAIGFVLEARRQLLRVSPADAG